MELQVCVWQMWSRCCDMFSHGRESFSIGPRNAAARCVQCEAIRTQFDLCVIRTQYNFCNLYNICDTCDVLFAHDGCSNSMQYPNHQSDFVFSRFQWEVLYKICPILCLVYPKFLRILKIPKIYIQFSQKWLFFLNFAKYLKYINFFQFLYNIF